MAVVESERSVAGDVLCRNGHMARDWRKMDSMVARGWSCGAQHVWVGGGCWLKELRALCGNADEGCKRLTGLCEGQISFRGGEAG